MRQKYENKIPKNFLRIAVGIMVLFADTEIYLVDTYPPASINQLKNVTYKPTYINWTWKDPTTSDFSKVMIYINGEFKTNVTKGKMSYNATSLIPNTLYKISTHTVDTSGNINLTWKNHTVRTSFSNDKFGIKRLYPTISGGREWFSKWNNGIVRNWSHQENDPYDPEFWTADKGHGSFRQTEMVF